jgi:hypothetical protein
VRFDPQSLHDGALSVLARAYFASFALLSPFSIAGYVLHTPLLWFSIACSVCMLVGAGTLVWLARTRGPTELWKRPSWFVVACVAWCAFDLCVGGRVGTHTLGDASFHIARARMLMHTGMGSWDPLVDGRQFEPIYHTNLYHALIAVSAQWARVDPATAWVALWPVAKLWLLASTYELALRVLGDQRCAWVAALSASAVLATQSVLPVPNTLCCFVLLPFGAAAAVHMLRHEPRVRDSAWLGAASLALAQVHILYAIFFVLLVWPLLAARFCLNLARKQGRGPLLAALGATLLCVPWIAVPALPHVLPLLRSVAHAQPPGVLPIVLAVADAKRALLVDVGNGLVRMKLDDFLGWQRPITQLSLLLAALAFVTKSPRVFAALGLVFSMALYLFVPALCSLLLALLKAPWVIARFAMTLRMLSVALVTASALALVTQIVFTLLRKHERRKRWADHTLSAAGLSMAIGYAQLYGQRNDPWTVPATQLAFEQGRANVVARELTERAQFFAAQVPTRTAVLAPLWMDYSLPMVCNCYAFAFRSGRGYHATPNIEERRRDTEAFYAPNTTPSERLRIVRDHQLKHIYSSTRRLRSITSDLAPLPVHSAGAGADALIHLD